ncbi:MAG: PEP/pyruvate-binding domain-containing protein [Planctomycetota bacterium]|jgi:pyruvate,water dikinase|nr:PEP/pyruvate-binding domain-containing protein [Planctomycetota bacterium]MDP6762897.1 PEP/pyruvate-binding domain-containing protein [Planctomycetota bacterium]MDP6990879.1 PEP/pyruvate-binding domain-containing protein [Planctomycetota bacterium]
MRRATDDGHVAGRGQLASFADLAADPARLEQAGRKAQGLVRLESWGLRVPPGAVVLTGGFEQFVDVGGLGKRVEAVRRCGPPDRERCLARAAEAREAIVSTPLPEGLARDLEAFLQERPAGARYAVRSSGTKEDLHGVSFAGMYTTVLGAQGLDQVAAAIRECWASAFNERVLSYCLDRAVPLADLAIAVVLQELVDAERSGVAFTVNPVTGADREVVIEACFGLGEALVDGSVTPEQVRYDWFRRVEVGRTAADQEHALVCAEPPALVRAVPLAQERRERAVLSPEEAARLAELAVGVQAEYGFPVDIEWAWAEGEPYLLQARPITAIRTGGIEGEWSTADFKDGGVSSTVCTPFMWSLYDSILERTMPAYLRGVRLLGRDDETVWGEMFFGRPYWNLARIKQCFLAIPGFVEREFDEELGIEVAYEGRGRTSRLTPRTLWNAARVFLALQRAFREQSAGFEAHRRRQQARLAVLDAIDPAALGREELLALYETLVGPDYRQSEGTYFTLVYNNSNLQSLTKGAFTRLGGEVDLLTLFSGLTDVSHLLPNFELWDVSRKIRASVDARAAWESQDDGQLTRAMLAGSDEHCLGELAEVVRRSRHHATRELDLSVPRYGEAPRIVVEHCRDLLGLEDEADPRRANARAHEAYLAERERMLRLAPFHRRRGLAARLDRLREFLWWREELRDLSTRFYFFVRRFTLEVARRLVGGGDLAEVDDVFFLALDDLLGLARGELTAADAARLVARNRLYYRSFRHYRNPDEIGEGYGASATGAPAGPGAKLEGVACSPGVVTGRVRVVRDIFDADRLEEGDVLVTRYTDPGWTPRFGLLAGVATETGGLLSHAAVISREYGIPAVLAVRDLCARLPDGALVTLDGDAGTIRVHPEDGTAREEAP